MKLVFDVGGTRVKYGVADEEGNFLFTGEIPTPHDSPEAFLLLVKNIYRQAEQSVRIDGAAFGFPGEVYSEEGVIRGISAVEYLHELPLKELLAGCFDRRIPVTMANDANCAALGELWKGIAREHQNVAFVICGTGIGGAVIEQGKLYTGSTMNRGEFGNYPMGGYQDGMLLTWSDYTLEKQARKYHDRNGFNLSVNGRELEELAVNGDREARILMTEFYHWMAVGCINVEFSFDPQMIAIGGGISNNDRIIKGIQDTVNQMLYGQHSGYLVPRIVACMKGSQANLYGALYYHLNPGVINSSEKEKIK